MERVEGTRLSLRQAQGCRRESPQTILVVHHPPQEHHGTAHGVRDMVQSEIHRGRAGHLDSARACIRLSAQDEHRATQQLSLGRRQPHLHLPHRYLASQHPLLGQLQGPCMPHHQGDGRAGFAEGPRAARRALPQVPALPREERLTRDQDVAEWVREEGEPNGWTRFGQDMPDDEPAPAPSKTGRNGNGAPSKPLSLTI